MRQTTSSGGRDRSERELLVAGDPELAHEVDVERRAEGLGDLVADGDAATRKREDDDVVAAGEAVQLLGEQASGLPAVAPAAWPHRLCE